MHSLFKPSGFFIVSILILLVVQAGYAQNNAKYPRSVRDSLRAKVVQRDSLMRSFKHSDGSLNASLGKIEGYNSLYTQINYDLSRGFDTLDISQGLPSVEKQMALMKPSIENSNTLGYLVTLRDIIDHSKGQMNDWQDQLNIYNAQLDKFRKDITSFKADTALRTVPIDSNLREKSFMQVHALELKWSKLDSDVKKAIIKIGLLQNRVSSMSILLIDLDERIDLKMQRFTLKAITNEYGFIWDMHRRNSAANLDSTIVKTYELNIRLYKYLLNNKLNYWAHLASLLLLLAFFTWIHNTKRKINRIKDNCKDILKQTHYIVNHALLSTITVVSITVPYFYDHPHQAFLQTMLIIMMASIGLLIKSYWPKPLFNLWKMLLGLVLVFSFSNLLILITYTDRLLILSVSCLAIYVSYKFLTNLKKSPEDYPPYLEEIIKLFIILQSISIVLNITGRFSLAKVIGSTATFNLCLAMGLYLFIQILMESLFLQLEANKSSENQSITSYIDFKILQKKFKDVIIKVAAIIWLYSLTKNLAIDDYLYDHANDFLNHPHKFSSTAFTFGSILIFIVVIWISGLVARVISYFYDFAGQQVKLTPQAKKTRSSILLIRLTVFVIGFFVAITAAGIPMDRVTIIIGALGVGIGFGLQNIVNNLVSGIILAFEKPVQVGDIIEVSGKSGTIKEIGIRSSKIACGDGSELIVPNGDLISQHVVNWTLSDNNRRVELIVGVAYGSDLVKTEAILRKIITGRDDIMETPEPSVFLHNFSEYAIDFRIWFWAADINTWLSLKSKIISEIYMEFTKQGIEIPHPKRDIQVYFPDGTNVSDLIKSSDAPKENPPGPVQ